VNLQFLGSSPLLASGRQYGLWPETGFLEIGPPLSPLLANRDARTEINSFQIYDFKVRAQIGTSNVEN